MKRLAIAGFMLMLLMLLTGCMQPEWTRPGATTAEVAADRNACIREANGGYFGEGKNAQINYDGYVDRCLRARGYTQIARRLSRSGDLSPIGSLGRSRLMVRRAGPPLSRSTGLELDAV
jgi:hypothetical protein